MKKYLLVSVLVLTALGSFAHSSEAAYSERCRASWYGDGLQGNLMANGKRFNMNDASVVAHKSLPFGTKLKITNLNNGRSVRVVVQDRGPYIHGRCVDLSKAAARQIGLLKTGTAPVLVERQ